MTNEEKQLLYKDLCGRLPYGVKIKFYSTEYPYGSEPVILTVDLLKDRWENIHDVKPYLRPMDSMTEEEEIYYNTVYTTLKFYQKVDWLNAHHFDFRGLIQKEWSNQNGLALEAPEGIYKTE